MEGSAATPHTSISEPNDGALTPNERNLQLKCDRLQEERDRFKHGLRRLRAEHMVLQARFEELEICKGDMEDKVRQLELSYGEMEDKVRRVEAEKLEMEETIRRLSERTPEPSMEEMEQFVQTVAPSLTLPGWYEPQLATPPNDEHHIEEVDDDDEEMDLDQVTLPELQYPFDGHDSTSTSEDEDSEESSPSPPPSKPRRIQPSISPSLTSNSTLVDPTSPVILDSIRVKPRPRPPLPPPQIKRQIKGGMIRGRGGAPLILSSPPKKQTATRPHKKRVSSLSTRASARIARLSQPPLTVSIVPAKPDARTPTQWDVDAGRRVSVPPPLKFMLRIPPRPQALAAKN